jgi:hypothetical protein
MYRNRAAMATAGNTRPTRGTMMEGKKEAAIRDFPTSTLKSQH